MNSVNTLGNQIASAFTNALGRIVSFIPQLIAGLIILIIGIVIAAVLRTLVRRGLDALDLDRWFAVAGIEKGEHKHMWSEILSQLVYWTIFLAFLIPAVESWGVPRITNVLNQLLDYIPNVFAAVIIGFIGLVLANLVGNIVHDAASGYAKRTANLLSGIARYALMIFAAFIVLNQLGVASNLIQILFTGAVITVALGAGLAIGLGGQDAVKIYMSQILEKKSSRTKH